MSTLEQFVREAARRTEKVFHERGVIMPMWHAITRDGEALVFGAPSPDKATGIAMARALFELRDVIRYCFIDEAWIVAAIDNPTLEQLEAVRDAIITGAEASPARQEVIAFWAEDHAEGQAMARRHIIRRPNAPPSLGPLIYDGGRGEYEGQMTGLLPRPAGTRVQ